MYKIRRSDCIRAGFLSIVMLLGIRQAAAQLNPMGSIYYQNQYLANPAVAGDEPGLDVSMGYRQQWSGMPGAPVIQSITSEYGLTDRVGLGINLYTDQAGLMKRTRLAGTYAYHLPLDDDQKLHFGISLGFMNERLERSEIIGDPNDVNIGLYNNNESYIDADFGLAYSSRNLLLQGALPNMKSLFQNSSNTTIDYNTFFSAVSYRIYLAGLLNGIALEPKMCYRGVKGYDNIADFGARLGFIDNAINLMAMYHSTRSATFSVGMDYRSTLAVTGVYTTSTGVISDYNTGSFEIGLRLKLISPKK